MRLVLALLIATAPVALAAQPQAPAPKPDGPVRGFTGADLFGLSIAADPQISPDGRTIVYGRRSGDVMTDRMLSSLWLIDVASGRQSPFATQGSSPRWSPDGTRIAWLGFDDTRRSNENMELYVGDRDAGAPRSVTASLDSGIEDAQWGADGRTLYASYDDHGQRRVPPILEIHGGPHAAYGPGFATDMQLYAAAGYAVVWANPRGSTSYREEFANLIDKNYPSADRMPIQGEAS